MKTPAIAYLRTSSAANVGGDSDKRQRDAITRYAKAAGLEVVREFYDAAVSGADPIDQREGLRAFWHGRRRTISAPSLSRTPAVLPVTWWFRRPAIAC